MANSAAPHHRIELETNSRSEQIGAHSLVPYIRFGLAMICPALR
jgi:hypothetical protein